ncbi:MAG: AmmeMemoRadiSam system protein B [Puniceicoccales bacterium]|jgi:AmmeMemoRadiSam system protein B/AmmeMemoRadiSam system protein A|nr:AmmeMemoRadiSam system protein B [Puniceicoccales bacterium]
MRRIRGAEVCGVFYDLNPSVVGLQLRQWTEHFPCYLAGANMLFVPHAGYVYSGQVAARAYKQLANGPSRRVFMLADNHQREWATRGVAVPNFDAFQIFDHQISVDRTFCADLLEKFPNIFHSTEKAYNGHVIEVHLPMLLHFMENSTISLVPLVFQGTIEEERRMLAEYLHSRWTDGDLIIISSDLSHYLPAQSAEARDHETLAALLSERIPLGENCLCGREALSCAQHIASRRRWICNFIDYTHSGVNSSAAARVVGYGALAWTREAIRFPDDAFIALEKLAMRCIECALTQVPPPDMDQLLKQFPQFLVRQSVFVTLMKNGRLRGCIGGLGDFSQTVLDGVQRRAIDAAFRDSRFPPVTSEELRQLEAHVSILSFPTELQLPCDRWIEHLSGVNPKPGIILEIGGRTSTFLPEVWEQIPEPKDFLCALCRKQGVPEDAWKNPMAKLFLYTTQTRHELY